MKSIHISIDISLDCYFTIYKNNIIIVQEVFIAYLICVHTYTQSTILIT
jgi:hypothetical protein